MGAIAVNLTVPVKSQRGGNIVDYGNSYGATSKVVLFHPFGVGVLGIYFFAIIIPSLRDLKCRLKLICITLN